MGRSLAIAMIVKDESAHLAECLNSARAIADEICVVDTGSSDDTVAVARRFDAKVDTVAWCDDFAAARNASLRLCTKDWIFVLDADERLAASDLPAIRSLIDGPMACCYRMMTRNYTNAENTSEFHPGLPGDSLAQGFAGWFPSWKVRLFPNHTGAGYEGTVHELIRESLEARGVRVLQSDAVVHHYPLLRDAVRIRDKQRLYLRLGQEKIRRFPHDPRPYVELGRQYADLGDYANAVAAYQESLRYDSRNAEILKELGGILHVMRQTGMARKSLELAVQYDPGLTEAWRNLGVVHADQGEWAAAVDCFARAVILDPEWIDGPRYLSVALDRAGRLEDAVQAAQKAVEANPGSLEALNLYADQMARLGRHAEACGVLRRLSAKGGARSALAEIVARLSVSDSPAD